MNIIKAFSSKMTPGINSSHPIDGAVFLLHEKNYRKLLLSFNAIKFLYLMFHRCNNLGNIWSIFACFNARYIETLIFSYRLLDSL